MMEKSLCETCKGLGCIECGASGFVSMPSRLHEEDPAGTLLDNAITLDDLSSMFYGVKKDVRHIGCGESGFVPGPVPMPSRLHEEDPSGRTIQNAITVDEIRSMRFCTEEIADAQYRAFRNGAMPRLVFPRLDRDTDILETKDAKDGVPGTKELSLHRDVYDSPEGLKEPIEVQYRTPTGVRQGWIEGALNISINRNPA